MVSIALIGCGRIDAVHAAGPVADHRGLSRGPSTEHARHLSDRWKSIVRGPAADGWLPSGRKIETE
jgi:hypothetical protein